MAIFKETYVLTTTRVSLFIVERWLNNAKTEFKTEHV
jgi:hypothetical protein